MSNRCRTMLWTMCTFERLRFVNELLNSRAEASGDEIAERTVIFFNGSSCRDERTSIEENAA